MLNSFRIAVVTTFVIDQWLVKEVGDRGRKNVVLRVFILMGVTMNAAF
jgi:hypothetical protein